MFRMLGRAAIRAASGGARRGSESRESLGRHRRNAWGILSRWQERGRVATVGSDGELGMRAHGIHTDSMYVHHTRGSSGRDSAAVTVGIVHAIERLAPGIGYFRPIDSTPSGGLRTTLVQRVFKLADDIKSMQGVTDSEAYDALAEDKLDDMLEEILKAYDAYKKNHDFVVVEGASMKDGRDMSILNGKIAGALGTPVLLVTDGGVDAHGKTGEEWEDGEWEREVVNATLLSHAVFSHEGVDCLGSLIHRMPLTLSPMRMRKLALKFEEHSIPFAGAIPEDNSLISIQVHDVIDALNGELLYGGNLQSALAAEVTQFIVATMQLSDLLCYLPTHKDPSKGSCVITSANRADVLLGMLNLHESHTLSNVTAVVLTGGHRPSPEIDLLVKTRTHFNPLPVILASVPSYEAACILSQVEGHIKPQSSRKIERSQALFDEYVDMDIISKALSKERKVRMNPKLFAYTLFQRAKSMTQHIVLPEGVEPRVLQAAAEIVRRGLCEITLLGDEEKIKTATKQLRLDISRCKIVTPATSPHLDRYAEDLYEKRKHKGMTLDEAHDQLMNDVNSFGTAMVAAGDADGMVSGAIHTTANTVRPALQIIKTQPETKLVSSVFFMCLPDKVLVYGDCAINTDPTAEELAMIAVTSADTAMAFGIEPRIAMLSYATGDSNTGPIVQKVADAAAIAKEMRPDLMIEGPIQYDAAVNPETAKTKFKGRPSEVAGKATVLIFPDLNTGNNTYKAVQQSTGAIAMGPLLQGLRKPVNDLSRGCTVNDIVTTVTLTSIQAQALKNKGGQNSVPEAAARA